MLDLNQHPVLVVMTIGVIAPLLAEIPLKLRVPTVVLEMAMGIIIGPHVLDLVQSGGLLGWMGGKLGLAALFFMAGMELDLERLRGRPLVLAGWGWLISFALGIAAAEFLYVFGLIQYPAVVAVALTTTAIGTLLPILRDAGDLDSEFGRLLLAAGAIGELGPIVIASLALTPGNETWTHIGFMAALSAITILVAVISLRIRSPRIVALIGRTLHSSSQLPVRITMLLIAILFVLAEVFGLEVVLGAFAAGMVFGMITKGETGKLMRLKIDAISFGFFVPFFFVTSGINFDLATLFQSTKAIFIMPIFLVLFLVARGIPVILYRNHFTWRESFSFALYVSTALPMVVAITHIGVQTGRLQAEIATALVGAAVLSVLLFPAIARGLRTNIKRNYPNEMMPTQRQDS